MNLDMSVMQYFFNASIIVKCVLIILLLASLFSWIYIFQKGFYLRWMKRKVKYFEKNFWKAKNIGEFYQNLASKKELEGVEKIFVTGFKEFLRLHQRAGSNHDAIIEGVQRAMRAAHVQTVDQLENHLSFLATVGSVSPYVGLFGTVWGIMMAFQALGHVSQATISMVAPGISEALITTAMGLFAAIPAVIAYNRYSNSVERLLNRFDGFEEEFINYLHRQLHSQSTGE